MVLASVYEPLIVGHVVVGDTTVAVEDALAVAHAVVVIVAVYISPATNVSPVLVQVPLASTVIV
jgi:hypothetical protein